MERIIRGTPRPYRFLPRCGMGELCQVEEQGGGGGGAGGRDQEEGCGDVGCGVEFAVKRID